MAKDSIFIKEGGGVDFTAASDLNAGATVVIGEYVGVTQRAIATGELGTLHTHGVHEVPKATGTAWTQGMKLYYDESASQYVTTDDSGANKFAGLAHTAAASGDALGRIELRPGA